MTTSTYTTTQVLGLAVLAVAITSGVAVQEVDGTTVIEGVEITWHVSDSKGNPYEWTMPVATYENLIVESRYHVRDKMNLNLDGETVQVVSLDGFVKRSFAKVIDDVYHNSVSNSDFIWEVWYIVSQLTVYDEDLHEYSEGRYALETLTRSGGDCEDLTILIADMLMSSKYTDNWTIQYLIMDSDNPTNPQKINHAMLYVNDGKFSHYVDAVRPPSWSYYPDGVRGWYLDIVPYTDELDFSGQDLRDMNLRQRDFSYADMSGARLNKADLGFSDLRYADLSGADLSEANLYGAYLEGADLSGAILNNATLIGVYLGDADLSNASLFGADMRRAAAYDADLSGAFLWQANLYGADMPRADLSGAYLAETILGGVNLFGANLRNADLSNSQMYGTNLQLANTGGAVFDGATMVGVIGLDGR